MNAPIFIPKHPASLVKILPGSAIVGGQLLDNDVRRMVYFEGNKYNDLSLKRFVVRCLHAHGRMAKKYPTVAKMSLLIEDLVQVGEYDPIRCAVSVHKPADLAKWIGTDLVIPNDQLIYQNPLVVRDLDYLKALADTESPGDFKMALNHGIVSSKRIQWDTDHFYVHNEIDDTVKPSSAPMNWRTQPTSLESCFILRSEIFRT